MKFTRRTPNASIIILAAAVVFAGINLMYAGCNQRNPCQASVHGGGVPPFCGTGSVTWNNGDCAGGASTTVDCSSQARIKKNEITTYRADLQADGSVVCVQTGHAEFGQTYTCPQTVGCGGPKGES